jgi:8-oxo-dGTP diphosphatase
MKKKSHCHFCGNPLTEKASDGRLRLFCPSCDQPIYENPIPATCLIVPDGHEKILLVKRSVEPKSGLWCLPGGFIELGETPEKAALRELHEETSLRGKIDRLLGVTTNTSLQYHTVLMIGYLVKDAVGTPRADDDASDLAFFSKDAFPEIAFDSHRRFIRIYFAAYASQ